ncbi:MAG: radical SAM protein [Oscillospiraceae bacterium]|nr:radical SAM protein [Oscillospiraceae bacterium]
MEEKARTRTAGEAGWRLSRYNMAAKIEGSGKIAVANLFRGTCGAYSPAELYLLDVLETLPEDHPILDRFAKRGLIVNFDEIEALKAMRGTACAAAGTVSLTICPTMGCNFDCPYCFENHKRGVMTPEVQDDVVSFAGRMLDAFGANKLSVTWFGGEPLLAAEVIEKLSERLIALAGEKGAEYRADIITNGYLLTEKTVDILEKCLVSTAQVTLDGLGGVHDATRHLAGGGPTFERITHNLRTLRLPFRVIIRHNVHEGNSDQSEPLRELAEKLAEESGNDIDYYASPVSGNDAAEKRGSDVRLLCGSPSGELGIRSDALRFRPGSAHYCGSGVLSCIGIDERGRLHKCWEDADKPEHSFGSASRWDPRDPIATADSPDKLTVWLNAALPADDAECMGCKWLPACVGGCPARRIYYRERPCLPYRDTPEKYVLALYERMKRENGQNAVSTAQELGDGTKRE